MSEAAPQASNDVSSPNPEWTVKPVKGVSNYTVDQEAAVWTLNKLSAEDVMPPNKPVKLWLRPQIDEDKFANFVYRESDPSLAGRAYRRRDIYSRGRLYIFSKRLTILSWGRLSTPCSCT